MTPEEIKEEARWKRRKQVFIAEGLPEDDAHDLAARMMMRDRDPFDDRRVCFECEHHRNRYCQKILNRWKPTQQLRFILQRCDYFKLKGTT